MNSWRVRARLRLFGRRVTVPIARCVHFGGFRYGLGEPHPYETYVLRAQEGRGAEARAWLVEFLQHYRPGTLAEALGVQLDRNYDLWQFPWMRDRPPTNGWLPDPFQIPDIITHFSNEGVLWFRIEQEFFWLERALYSIRRYGYKPVNERGIIAWRFLRVDGSEAFLILDGNHRLSALAALGHETVELSYVSRDTVNERDAARWPQVKANVFTTADAIRVFHAYFDGNRNWRTTSTPAPLLERPA